VTSTPRDCSVANSIAHWRPQPRTNAIVLAMRVSAQIGEQGISETRLVAPKRAGGVEGCILAGRWLPYALRREALGSKR
jgi:hypothetical protein